MENSPSDDNGENSEIPFGSSGGSRKDVEEEFTVRVSRDMKRKLEVFKSEKDEYRNMRSMMRGMVEMTATDMYNMVNGLFRCIDFADRYEDNVSSININMDTYEFNNDIITFGKLNHYISVPIRGRFSGSLGQSSTGYDISKSDLIRMCFIKCMYEWSREDDVNIEYSDKEDIRKGWEAIRKWSSRQKRKFMGFMYSEFVDINDLSVRDISDNYMYAQSLYDQLESSDHFEDIVSWVGKEPFDSLENILEETKEGQ